MKLSKEIRDHYKEIGKKGGDIYWASKTKEEKSDEMRRRRLLGIKNKKHVQTNQSKEETNTETSREDGDESL